MSHAGGVFLSLVPMNNARDAGEGGRGGAARIDNEVGDGRAGGGSSAQEGKSVMCNR